MFIEENCTFVHKGRSFTSGGAVITENHLVAYLGKAGVVNGLAWERNWYLPDHLHLENPAFFPLHLYVCGSCARRRPAL